MSKKKTHEEFVAEMKIISPQLEIVGQYKQARQGLLVRDKYGICNVSPTNLLKGKKPTMQSAVDKDAYFRAQLIEVGMGDIEYEGNYVRNNTPLVVNTKYGKCISNGMSLLAKQRPTIQSAIDKNSYFIKKAKEIHGDKYDYSKINITNMHKKVEIICPIHGSFFQIPTSHITSHTNGIGHGCKRCSVMKFTSSEICNKILKLHPGLKIIDVPVSKGDRIRVYNGYGVCNVLVSTLLVGKKPGILTSINKTSYFKNKLNKVDPNIVFEGEYTKIEDKMLIHSKYGDCMMTPEVLLLGSKPGISSAINKTEFAISRCKEKFGDTFDYSKVIYVSNKNKIKIVCPEHGEFESQLPTFLNSQYGCPVCGLQAKGYSRSDWVRKSRKRKCTVYIIKCSNKDEEFIKIGITCNTVKRRFDHWKALPYNWEIIEVIESKDAGFIWDEERRLHKIYKEYSYLPNLCFQGKTECFTLEVLKTIKNNINQ